MDPLRVSSLQLWAEGVVASTTGFNNHKASLVRKTAKAKKGASLLYTHKKISEVEGCKE